MKWLRSRPVDVHELDECRIWAQNQEAVASQADLGDSEMIDGNDEIDDGEIEDEDMEAAPEDPEQEHYDLENASAQVREVTQRKKQSRRRNHDALLNGNAGGTVVSVGDGG